MVFDVNFKLEVEGESFAWLAICADPDIVTSGPTLEIAADRFRKTVQVETLIRADIERRQK